MSTLIFPSSPYSGQIYPEQPIPGTKQYRYNAQADTWELNDAAPCICLPANNVILDNIAESFDGINTTFGLTLSGSPYEPPNAAQMIVTVGNIMQEAFVEYTIAGATITFTTAPEAGLDCVLLVLAGGQEAPASNLLLDDIQADFNGTTATFLLKYEEEPYTPINEEQLVVNLGGIQQKPGEHYTVASDAITFTTPPAAGINCFIVALYGGGFGAPGGGGGPQTFLIDTDNNIWSCNTAITPGGAYNNFLVGECAGANLTGACNYNNTFIGNYAGFCAGSVPGGGCVDDNIFIGSRTGSCFTCGWSNTFIGKCSGQYATGGLGNNFLGAYTGQYNTTGNTNVFIGQVAGEKNLTGTANNFIGTAAGRCNTSGNCNNVLGYCAGNFNTTGSFNTLVGTETGYCNTTGVYNTFFGSRSGYNNTTGGNNVAVGYCAGADAVGNITTQSNQIVIGNNSHTNAFVKVGWTVTSDERDKTCVSEIPHGRDFLQKLEPVQFNWKDRESGEVTDEKPRYGFLAQQVLDAEGEPAIIVDDSNPEHLKLRESMMIPVLFKIIQEMDEELRALRTEVNALRG